MLVRIANREDPDQTASSSVSALFVQAILQQFWHYNICLNIYGELGKYNR